MMVPSAQQREPSDFILAKIARVDEVEWSAAEFYIRIGAGTRILTCRFAKDTERGAQFLAPKKVRKKRKELKTVIMNFWSEKLGGKKGEENRAEKGKSPFWPSIRLSHANLPVYSVVFGFFNVACC